MRTWSGDWSLRTGETEDDVRSSVDSLVTSVLSGDTSDNVFNDRESGTGLTETSEMEDQAEGDPADENVDDHLLDQPDSPIRAPHRMTPEGQEEQVISTSYINEKTIHDHLIAGRKLGGHSGHRWIPGGEPGGGHEGRNHLNLPGRG